MSGHKKTSPPSVCIVTPDLIGPVRNGGIGTACAALAHGLVGGGFGVSILFTQCSSRATLHDDWIKDYADAGIDIAIAEQLAHDSVAIFPAHPPLRMASIVFKWLVTRSFDVVVFMDWQGHGFYAFQAKRAGLHFTTTTLITHVHSPTLWHELNNAGLSPEPATALTRFMERKCIEMADAAVSPSYYMLDWLRSHGFRLPRRQYVIPNPIQVTHPRSGARRMTLPISEIVFFGRLEYRKGIVQFCDALDQLAGSALLPARVTFLGKFGNVEDEHSVEYIARRSKDWKFPVQILGRLDSTQAIEYLAAPSRLAVMPSVAENSPFTVYECLVARIPFLARDVGGVPELIRDVDRPQCLFDGNPASLAAKMGEALQHGAAVMRLAFDEQAPVRYWLTLLSRSRFPPRATGVRRAISRRRSTRPKVSVCLTHFDRPRYLRQAVKSLMAQDYKDFEVILVDDGSRTPEARRLLDSLEAPFSDRGWSIVRAQNGYLGKARNTAAKVARGSYLLFMDDDNVARREMVGRFVKAAEASGAGVVTSMFDVFTGDKEPTSRTQVVERFMPVGNIVSYSVVANAIGDANSLFRRDVFQSLGGFTEDYGLGHEDFELLLRATLSGVDMLVIPEPMFWYRRSGSSMLQLTPRAANQMRSLRPMLERWPVASAELAVMAHAVATRPPHTLKDPESIDSLTSAVRTLQTGGQYELAVQVLQHLPSLESAPTDDQWPATLHDVISAAKARDSNCFHRLLRGLRPAKDASATTASLLVALTRELHAGNSQSRRKILKIGMSLAAMFPASPQVHLRLAELHLHAGTIGQAVASIENALDLADAQYLRARPDVDQAVKKGEFGSGLHHYGLYGISEQSPWPERRFFEQVFAILARKIRAEGDGLRVVNMHARADLAFRLFVNRDTSDAHERGDTPGGRSLILAATIDRQAV